MHLWKYISSETFKINNGLGQANVIDKLILEMRPRNRKATFIIGFYFSLVVSTLNLSLSLDLSPHVGFNLVFVTNDLGSDHLC